VLKACRIPGHWTLTPLMSLKDSKHDLIDRPLSEQSVFCFMFMEHIGTQDPCWCCLQGVMRRGMQVSALREFILSQGASKNVTVQEWDKIWTMNKKVQPCFVI